MENACQSASLGENPALLNAVLKYAAAEKGVDIEVFMPYAAKMKSVGEWYVQLLAESLGKRKDREGNVVYYGRTPVSAVGSTDMHAQTQQHQDGKKDKVIQFVEILEREQQIEMCIRDRYQDNSKTCCIFGCIGFCSIYFCWSQRSYRWGSGSGS